MKRFLVMLLAALMAILPVAAFAEEEAAVPEKVELSEYLGSDINAFVEQFNTLTDSGASDAQEYADENIIVSSPWNAPEISFIYIGQACDFTIYGFTVGDEFAAAADAFFADGWTEMSSTETFYELSKDQQIVRIWSLDGTALVTSMALLTAY